MHEHASLRWMVVTPISVCIAIEWLQAGVYLYEMLAAQLERGMMMVKKNCDLEPKLQRVS